MTKSATMITALTLLTVISANGQAAERIGRQAPTVRQMEKSTINIFKIPPKFSCIAANNRDFGSGLVVKLLGPYPVAAGTKVHWKLAKTNNQGTTVLPALSPQQDVYIDTQVANVGAFLPCTVNVVSLP